MSRRPIAHRVAADSVHPAQYHQRSALTLVEVLVIVALIGVVIALLLPTVRSAREPARRNSCLNNLKQISLGLQNYANAHGAFPPAYTTDAEGKPLHSWRTLILPFMEQQELFKTIDLTKPWDHPANAQALKSMPAAYGCPSAPDLDNRTTYLAIVTPTSCIQSTEPRNLDDVKDRHEATLVLIEVDAEHAVPWMAPIDADESLVLSLGGPGWEHLHAGGTLGTFVDGHSKFIPADISPDVLRGMISIADDGPGVSAEAE